MRIRVNRRYYFKWDWGGPNDRTTYFGYFYKHRNAVAWDYDNNMNYGPLRFRLKCYNSDGPTKFFSSKDKKYKYYYYEYLVTGDIKNIDIITSKQFNTYMTLYGPKES
jgi:hypothetical protein